MLRSIPQGSGAGAGVWIDLLSPDEAELREVEERTGIRVPDLAALREIEATSRLRVDGEILYMTAPMITGVTTDHWQYAPTGFILTPDRLVTVRYADLAPFDAVLAELETAADLTPALALARLLEEAVDRAADHLEHASEKVSDVSQTIFFEEPSHRGLSRETRHLRDMMRTVGRASDRASRVRYTFLSIGRMVNFVLDRCTPKLDAAMTERLEAIRHDILSLDEFETSLAGRIQLLQDAATAFISIEQNDVVKVLTVASVVGVPPVLVVGIYGMNFHHMPELAWPMGYPYALALCFLSGLIPYLWFKWRNWI